MYKKKEDLVCEQIDDEFIVFDTKNEQFFEFSGVGNDIWRCLEKMTPEEISQFLSMEYDIEQETALNDILIFLNDLLNKHLIYTIEGKHGSIT